MGDQKTGEFAELPSAALQALMHAHDTLLQFLKRRLPSNDAEDVMQDVYLRVVEHGTELRREESVRAWLMRVLRNALADHFRRVAARQRVEADYARQEDALSAVMEEADAVICMCLHGLMSLLRPEYAEVLRRADLEDEPREAIAASLGLTAGNLAVRLHRARQALRGALELSCQTCPIHGYLDCGCDYTRHLRMKATPGRSGI